MKLLLYLAAIVLFTSCSVFKKAKVSSYSNTDSTHVQKVDSSVFVQKDSVFTNHEQKEEVNELVIEFDSSGGAFYVGKEFFDDMPDYSKILPSDYFPEAAKQAIPVITGKVKKITIRNSQTANRRDSVATHETKTVQVNRSDSTKLVQETETKEKHKESKGIAWFVWVGCIVLFIGYAIWCLKTGNPLLFFLKRRKKEEDG